MKKSIEALLVDSDPLEHLAAQCIKKKIDELEIVNSLLLDKNAQVANLLARTLKNHSRLQRMLIEFVEAEMKKKYHKKKLRRRPNE